MFYFPLQPSSLPISYSDCVPLFYMLLKVCVCLCPDEPAPVGPHLRERQGSGETHADAGPC